MLTRIVLSVARGGVLRQSCRNLSVCTLLQQKQVASDPIQSLFLDKVHAYSNKSKAAGGKLVDVTPDMEKNLQADLDKVARQYSATGADFIKFPTFSFTDPELQPVGVEVSEKTMAEAELETVADDAQEDKPYWCE